MSELVWFCCPACDEEYRLDEEAEDCPVCGNEKIECLQ